MAKVKVKKSGSLVNSLENKILSLLERLLEERTIQLNNEARLKNENNGGGDDEEVMEEDDLLFFAKDLKYDDIYSYVLTKDMSMQRMKKHMIQRTIEKVWSELIANEDEEFKDYPLYNPQKENDEEAEESVDENNLVAITEKNDMNKGIVDSWNAKKRTTSTSAPSSSGKKIKKPKLKDRSPPDSDLTSLGGMDDVVAQLMELVGLPILHPEIFATTGIEPPRGILLHGPPGCGKTSIANALAGELKVPFISLSAPSVVSGMSGESEKKIRDIFQEAKQIAPCLIFFDEIDAITPKRDGGAQREMEKRIVAQLLTSMDELSFENTNGKPVIVIGATNRPDSLDPALRRAGRFDREICLNVPNEISRLHILKKMASSLKIDGAIDFDRLAKLTPGFVGADLKALSTAAGTCAIKRIFKNYTPYKDSQSSDVDMDSDSLSEKNTANLIDPLPLEIITNFIKAFPNPLSEEQLQQLSITYDDFLKALPTIQPTAKREGFATVPDVTWNNVGALSNVRIELNMAIVQPIKRPELYEKVGISAPAGVLLWGPPGCGKTLLAKAVANESRANFISIKGPELLNKYVGESERAIRQVFTRARASVPCIIFFDELDALVPRRDTSLSESSSRVVNTLLTELDGLNDRKGIFVVGATNRPDMIDPAMLRPGRLDKTLFIELPKRDEKIDILRTLIKSNGTPVADCLNLETIIDDERVRNFSGADLASLVRESSVSALKRSFFKNNEIQSVGENDLDKEFEDLSVGVEDQQIIVGMDDFNRALQKIKPSVSDKDRTKYDKLNKKMGWNDDVELKE
ncbi:ribosome biogenesis ATPase Rix7p [Monosporozyma servazzii]